MGQNALGLLAQGRRDECGADSRKAHLSIRISRSDPGASPGRLPLVNCTRLQLALKPDGAVRLDNGLTVGRRCRLRHDVLEQREQ
jgi:hypothetical protein